MSLDRGECVIKGTLSGKNREDEEIVADYTMRVVREGGQGKWGIRYLLISDRKSSERNKH
jgi:hypothetical protein